MSNSRVHSSVQQMVDDGLILDNVVISADNFNFKKYRIAHKNEDGSNFTQDDCAKMLNLTDKAVVSKFERNDSRIDDRTYSIFLLMTGNHPYYSLEPRSKNPPEKSTLIINTPAPKTIKAARMSISGLKQNQASKLLGLHPKMYGKYESTTASKTNKRSPSPHAWTLFLLLTKQHPYYQLDYKNKDV